MIRIVVGGQMDKERIAKKIEEIGKDKITLEVKTDLDLDYGNENWTS